jgi:hypothetical protein
LQLIGPPHADHAYETRRFEAQSFGRLH